MTSIVVGAAGYFYSYVSSNQQLLQNANNSKYKLELAYERLNRLILEADHITLTGRKLNIINKNRESIVSFNSNVLIIENGKIDSLNWSLGNYDFKTFDNSKIISELEISFDFEDLTFEWYFCKDYGAYKKMNLIGR